MIVSVPAATVPPTRRNAPVMWKKSSQSYFDTGSGPDGELGVHSQLLVARDGAVEVVRPGLEDERQLRGLPGLEVGRALVLDAGTVHEQVVHLLAVVRDLERVGVAGQRLRRARRQLDPVLDLADLDRAPAGRPFRRALARAGLLFLDAERSEEHTSELQSH